MCVCVRVCVYMRKLVVMLKLIFISFAEHFYGAECNIG